MRGDIWGKVFVGLLLIGAGVVFLLNQLGIVAVDIGYVFSNYWPVILIVFGLKGILIQRRLEYGWGGSYLWNLIIVVVGLVFLNNNLRWFDQIGFGDIFKFLVPVILIALGMNMLFRPRNRKSSREPIQPPSPPPSSPSNWDPPMESPFKPYSSYDPPAPPEPPSTPEQGPEAPPPPGAGPAKPPLDPFTPRPSGNASPSGNHGKPEAVHEWKHWKEQFKKDWKSHRDEFREDREFRRRMHGHRSSDSGHDGEVVHRSNFIGDLHMGQDYWELRSMNISHFIGDTELDLTRAVIPYGETKINISAFIGDVKVYVPNDVQLEVSVTASSFLGDINVFERREGGMFRSMQSASPGYKDAEKRVRIIVSMFIGDVRVKRVG
ncbi:cell wall-active antibiotics response protein LiaF [Paenibacillus sp. HJGM_3]|uniref:cell wall-active antibiotics response protein LiaF n=1 Tax=Paenibacillus sp. HJGM_3 TaxID=3379816 RepID=UPI00385C6ACA